MKPQSRLSITVDASLGVGVKDVCDQCVFLAGKLGINVRCQINSVPMIFFPNDSLDSAWNRYCLMIRREPE